MACYEGAYVYLIGGLLSILFGCVAQYYRNSAHYNINYPIVEKHFNRIGLLFLLLSCLSLWLIAALRNNVGVDIPSYQYNYNNINVFFDVSNYYEPGFGFLNYLIKIFFNDFQWVVVITALVTGACLWMTMYRDADSLLLCILGIVSVNLYFMSFSVIRQFMAVAVLMMSIPAIEQKNLKRFLLFYFIAVSIHYTAFVFIFVYYFSNQKEEDLLTWKNAVFFIGSIILLAKLDSILTNVIMVGGSLRENLSSYTTNGGDKSYKELLTLIPIVGYVVVYRKELILLNKRNRIYIWLCLFLVVFRFVGYYATPFSRVKYYFVMCIPILFSYLPSIFKNESRVISIIFLLIYYAWCMSSIVQYQWIDFLPYYSVFNLGE